MPNWLIGIAKWAAIFAAISLLFSWFGVYNTYTMAFPQRFSLWFMTMAVGGTTWHFAHPFIEGFNQGKLPDIVKVIVLASIVSVPITLSLILITGYNFNQQVFLVQYVYVLVVSLVLGFGRWLFDLALAGQAPQVDKVDPVVSFMERLPVKYHTAKLYAVSAEDHYLRVHTNLGEELILMRLADALRELVGANGLQTHRSWWVAKDGVADTEKADGKLLLVLKSGGRAAVSRTFASAVKEAGLS